MKYLLAISLLFCACETVRTVYDEHGNEVKPTEHTGQESDLMSRFEARINSSFQTKKNEEGVPEAVSGRVSSFQRELDAVRDTKESYATSVFGGVPENDAASVRFTGSKPFDAGKRFEGSKVSSYSQEMRPDFLNENRGLAHEAYRGGSEERSYAEGVPVGGMSGEYTTNASQYTRDTESPYFEGRRHKTPAPPVRNYRDYYNKEIMNVRSILGRDN